MNQAKQWFSAAELADMNLAGIPISKKGVIDFATRAGWQSRKREGRGGGLEYQPPKAILQQIHTKIADQHLESVINDHTYTASHTEGNAGRANQPIRRISLNSAGAIVADQPNANTRQQQRVLSGHASNRAGSIDHANSRSEGHLLSTNQYGQPKSGRIVAANLEGFTLEDCDKSQLETHRAIATLVAYVRAFNGSVSRAVEDLNQQYQASTLTTHLQWSYSHAWAKKRQHTQLSVSTLNKWLQSFKNHGHYAPKKRQEDNSVKPWHGLAIALRQRPQGSNLRWIAAEIAKQWTLSTPPPSYDTIYRFFDKKFSTGEQLKGRYTGSKLRSFQFYQHRTADGLAPGDEVHGDGWNTHFTAPHPVTGEFVTYEVWHFHDVATRYVPTPAIGLTENSEVIAKAIENVIRELGVPLHLQTDSTKVVRGNDKFTKSMHSLEERLGFTWVHPQTVGNSQANGIAENYNSSWLDMRSRELATYQNKNSMDDLTFKRVKKITTDMVKAQHAGNFVLRDQKRLEATRMGKGLVFESYDHAVQWLLTINAEFNDRPHRSLKKVRDMATGKMRQQTPKEALQEHLHNGWKPTALTETELIDAFRPHAIVKVVRETVSPYGGMRYRHEALRHWTGKTVVVAYDITDYKSVWVKDHKGALICEAEFVQATGYRTLSAQEFAAEKRTTATLKRIDKKRDTVIARADGHAVIEHQASMNKLMPFVFPDAPAEPVKLKAFVFPDSTSKAAPTMADTRTILRLLEEKKQRDDDANNEKAA